jgi:hypothetical protein
MVLNKFGDRSIGSILRRRPEKSDLFRKGAVLAEEADWIGSASASVSAIVEVRTGADLMTTQPMFLGELVRRKRLLSPCQARRVFATFLVELGDQHK